MIGAFSEHYYIHHEVKCSCKIKEFSSFFPDMNIDKTNLFKDSSDIKNFLNFQSPARYKFLFNKKNIFQNI